MVFGVCKEDRVVGLTLCHKTSRKVEPELDGGEAWLGLASSLWCGLTGADAPHTCSTLVSAILYQLAVTYSVNLECLHFDGKY